VDDAGAPCPPGQTGRVLVTLLHNPSFPIIRYEIGDLAQWAPPTPCACGLAWPRLQSVQGRADELLLTQDGTFITSVFIRHFLGVSLNRQIIRQWQIEQTGPARFVFRHVAEAGPELDRNLADIQAAFREALGRNITVEMVRVPAIALSPTGKTRWIINSWEGGKQFRASPISLASPRSYGS
jgi:phenylacetate-CoA ligase